MSDRKTVNKLREFQEEHNIHYLAVKDEYILDELTDETITTIHNTFIMIEKMLSKHLSEEYKLIRENTVSKPFTQMFSFTTTPDPGWLTSDALSIDDKISIITNSFRNTGIVRVVALALAAKTIYNDILVEPGVEKTHRLGFFVSPFPQKDESSKEPFTGFKAIHFGVIIDNSFAIASIMSSGDFRKIIEKCEKPSDQVFTEISVAITEDLANAVIKSFSEENQLTSSHSENTTVH